MTTAVQFGKLLRDARQGRGLSPEQLAAETHIPLNHLEALEAGQLHAIPAGLYRRAEARAYAEAVGLDPALVLSALQRALDPQAPEKGLSSHAIMASPVVRSRPASPTRRESVDVPKDPRAYWRVAAVLMLGGAALLFERAGGAPTPPSEMPVIAAADVTLDPANILDELVRFAEPLPSAPALSRTLFASGPQPPGPPAGDGRLASGRLVVQSNPAGARVTVNGVGWGVTPVAIRYLPLGPMRVRLVKEHYRAQERRVELTAATPTRTVRVTLPQIPGRRAVTANARSGPMLVVNTTPPGARLTVNGIGWGSTPVAIPHLPIGAQRLRVVKEQFISEERVVQVTEGQSRRVTIDLRPARSQ
jgi:transcriptional regulator with XRE-family HTH domain